jgi:hypothetical protein
MSVAEVGRWLETLGFPNGNSSFMKYAAAFEAEGVDARVMNEMKPDDLLLLGVRPKWHRILIIDKWCSLIGGVIGAEKERTRREIDTEVARRLEEIRAQALREAREKLTEKARQDAEAKKRTQTELGLSEPSTPAAKSDNGDQPGESPTTLEEHPAIHESEGVRSWLASVSKTLIMLLLRTLKLNITTGESCPCAICRSVAGLWI